MLPEYHFPYFDAALSDELFESLMAIDWEKRDDAPRYEYWTNCFGQPYTYGRGRGERTYESRPLTPEIEKIGNIVSCTLDIEKPYEGCFLNRYELPKSCRLEHITDRAALYVVPASTRACGCRSPSCESWTARSTPRIGS